MVKITKKTNLAELLKNPEAEKVLLKYKLPCLTCPFAQFELAHLELGEVCQIYGLETEKILSELNDIYKK